MPKMPAPSRARTHSLYLKASASGLPLKKPEALADGAMRRDSEPVYLAEQELLVPKKLWQTAQRPGAQAEKAIHLHLKTAKFPQKAINL